MVNPVDKLHSTNQINTSKTKSETPKSPMPKVSYPEQVAQWTQDLREEMSQEAIAVGEAIIGSHQKVQAQISPGLFCHIHSDNFAADSGLEGYPVEKSLEACCTYLENSFIPIPDKAALLKNYEKMREWDKKITSRSTDEAVEEIYQAIENLPEGESLEIAGGWTGKKVGHALIYSVTKTENNTIELSLFNTGDGGEYHYLEGMRGKLKIGCKMRLTQGDSNLMKLKEGLRALLELKTNSVINPGISVDAPSYLYTKLLPAMDFKTAPFDRKKDSDDPMTAQRSGTCTWRVQMAYLRDWIFKKIDDKSEALKMYKEMKRHLRLQSLLDFYQEHKENLADHNVGVQIEKTLARMYRSLKKAEKLGTLSKEERDATIGVLSAIRKALDISYQPQKAKSPPLTYEDPCNREAVVDLKIESNAEIERKSAKPALPLNPLDTPLTTVTNEESFMTIIYGFIDTMRKTRNLDHRESVHMERKVSNFLDNLYTYAMGGGEASDKFLKHLGLLIHDKTTSVFTPGQSGLLLACLNKLTEKRRAEFSLPPLTVAPEMEKKLREIDKETISPQISIEDPGEAAMFNTYLLQSKEGMVSLFTVGSNGKTELSNDGRFWFSHFFNVNERNRQDVDSLIENLPDWAKTLVKQAKFIIEYGWSPSSQTLIQKRVKSRAAPSELINVGSAEDVLDTSNYDPERDLLSLFVNFDKMGENLLILGCKYFATMPLMRDRRSREKMPSLENFGELLLIPGVLEKLFREKPHYIELYGNFFQEAISHFITLGQWEEVSELAKIAHFTSMRIPQGVEKIGGFANIDPYNIILDSIKKEQTDQKRETIMGNFIALNLSDPLPEERLIESLSFLMKYNVRDYMQEREDFKKKNYAIITKALDKLVAQTPEKCVDIIRKVIQSQSALSLPDNIPITVQHVDSRSRFQLSTNECLRLSWIAEGKEQILDFAYWDGSFKLNGVEVKVSPDSYFFVSNFLESTKAKYKSYIDGDYEYHVFTYADGKESIYRVPQNDYKIKELKYGNEWYRYYTDHFSNRDSLLGEVLNVKLADRLNIDSYLESVDNVFVNVHSSGSLDGPANIVVVSGTDDRNFQNAKEPRFAAWLPLDKIESEGNRSKIAKTQALFDPNLEVVVPDNSLHDQYWGPVDMYRHQNPVNEGPVGFLQYRYVDLNFDIKYEDGKEVAYSREYPGYYLIKKETRYGNKPETRLALEKKDGSQILVEYHSNTIHLMPDGSVKASTLMEHLQALAYYFKLGAFPDFEEKARIALSHCIPTRKMTEQEVKLMHSLVVGTSELSSPIISPEIRAIRLKLAVRLIDHYSNFPEAPTIQLGDSSEPLRMIVFGIGEQVLDSLLENYFSSPGISPPLQLTAGELKRLGASPSQIQAFFSESKRVIDAVEPTKRTQKQFGMPRDSPKNKNSIDWWLNVPTLTSAAHIKDAWEALVNVAKGNDNALKERILFRLSIAGEPVYATDRWFAIQLTNMLKSDQPIDPNLTPFNYAAIEKLYSGAPQEETSVPESLLYDHSERTKAANIPPLSPYTIPEEQLKPRSNRPDPLVRLRAAPPTVPATLWKRFITEKRGNKSTQTFSFKNPAITDPAVKHHLERIDKDLQDYRNATPPLLYRVNDRTNFEIEMKEIVHREEESLQQIEKELLHIAGKYPHDREERIRRRIDEQSGAIHPPTIQRLLMLYQKADDELFKKMNPELNDHEVKLIIEKLSSYIDLKCTIDRRKRVISKLNDGTDESLSEALSAMRSYNELPTKRLRSIQVFECLSGLTLRRKQVAMLKEILDGKVEGEHREFIKQLIMGGGKSDVILPLLAALLADGDNLSLLCIPRALLDSQREQLKQTCMKYFGKEIVPLEFDRASDCSEKGLKMLYNRLVESINRGQFLVVAPEAIEAIAHLESELFLNDKADSRLEVIGEILSIFEDRGVGILDEAHAILNARRELNFTTGDRKHIEQENLTVVREMYEAIATDAKLMEAIAINEDQSTSQAKQKGDEIKNSLANWAVNRYCLDLDPQEKETLRLYLKRDKSLKKTPEFIRNMPPEQKGRLALLREEIGRTLLSSLSKVSLQEYAYGPDGYAVPANHSQVTPGTEFGFPLESINTTYQLVLTTPIPTALLHNGMKRLVDTLKKHIADKVDISSLEEMALFKTIFPDLSLNDPLDKHLVKASEILRNNPKLALFFAEKYILPNLTYFPGKISSNSIRFVDRIGKVFGFSGTPSNDDSYPDRLGVGRAVLDKGTDGLTCDILLAMKPKVVTIPAGKEGIKVSPEKAADERIKGLQIEKGSNVRAIIDTAAYFKGIDNKVVAKSLAQEVGDENLDLNYYQSDTKIVAKETNPNKRVTFYDDAHTIGAHFDQAQHAEAVVIIGDNIELNHLLQAVWRMREIHKEQKVSFAMTEAVANLIREKQRLKPDVEIGIEQILTFAAVNQAERVALDAYRATSLKFSAAVHRAVQKAAHRNPKQAHEIAAPFKRLEGVFQESSNFNPWTQFGEVVEFGNTTQILINLREQWKEDIKELEGVEESLRNDINKALDAVIIPVSEKMPLESELPITNMGSEVVNEVQKQSESNKLSQTESKTLKLMQTENLQFKGKGGPKPVQKWTKNVLENIHNNRIGKEKPYVYSARIYCKFFEGLGSECEVYTSYNYTCKGTSRGEARESIGWSDQRPIRHLLVAETTTEPKKLRIIILGEDDMTDLDELMKENPSEKRWIYHLWSESCDSTPDQEHAKEVMRGEAARKAIVETKLLDGQVNYKAEEIPILERMISTLGYDIFLKEVSRFLNNRTSRKQFNGSILAQTLTKMG